MFASASSTFAPCEWHPGNSGQLTETPSSCSSRVTWNFRFTMLAYASQSDRQLFGARVTSCGWHFRKPLVSRQRYRVGWRTLSISSRLTHPKRRSYQLGHMRCDDQTPTTSAECADVEFETRSLPNLLVATLATLPSMSLIPSGSILSRLQAGAIAA